jgi:hypothetical protein
MDTFSDIIDRWPSLQDFADDLDVQYVTAQLMRHRNSIAPRHWKAAVRGAEKRQIDGVTLEVLAEIAAHDSQPRRSKKKRDLQPAA